VAEPTGVAASPAGIALPAGDVCPLLAVDLAGEVGSVAAVATHGLETPAGGRCTATSPAPSISADQRRLVCEGAGHLDCPRYVRATKGGRGPVAGRSGRSAAVAAAGATLSTGRPTGAADAGLDRPPTKTDAAPVSGPEHAESSPSGGPAAVAVTAAVAVVGPVTDPAAAPETAPTPVPMPTPVRPVTRSSGRSGARPAGSRPLPIVIAGSILVICLVIAFVFTSLRGGLALPGATTGSDASAGGALTTPGPTTVPSAPSATPSPSPAPTPSPSEAPSPSAATPSPSPVASLPAAYAGLKPCPNRARCYLYRIRSGDSLTKVADRFGVTLAAIKAINPEITAPSLLHVGDVIRVPLPRG
jgi:hypothetical protein